MLLEWLNAWEKSAIYSKILHTEIFFTKITEVNVLMLTFPFKENILSQCFGIFNLFLYIFIMIFNKIYLFSYKLNEFIA